MADILTLAEYKTLQGISDTSHDAQLTVLIPMVNDFIEQYCNRIFGGANYTERYEGVIDQYGRYVFKVKNRPLQSVSDISIYFIGANQTPMTLDVSLLDIFAREGLAYYTYALDPSIAVIRPEYADAFYYDITYSGGEAVPQAVKLAASMAVANAFKQLQTTVTTSGTQAGEVKSVRLDDYAESYETQAEQLSTLFDKNTGILLPQTIKDLLAPYKRIGLG